MFNSRMCQLVLGAGAMQVAGLKSITAKHLALSCQCLGALISLHPALVAAMGAHLPASRRALLTQELSLVLRVRLWPRPCDPTFCFQDAHTRQGLCGPATTCCLCCLCLRPRDAEAHTRGAAC